VKGQSLDLPIDSWIIFIELRRPKTTWFEGDLMILNAMMLWYFSITTSNGVLSWVTSHDTRGLPSITSTGIGCFFVTRGSLWRSMKSLFMKRIEAPESNKT
jgi:hypothetical protein